MTGEIERGSWAEAIQGIVGHFDIAAEFDLFATWNARGARACSAVIKEMARLLDDEIKIRADRRSQEMAAQAIGFLETDGPTASSAAEGE